MVIFITGILQNTDIHLIIMKNIPTKNLIYKIIYSVVRIQVTAIFFVYKSLNEANNDPLSVKG